MTKGEPFVGKWIQQNCGQKLWQVFAAQSAVCRDSEGARESDKQPTCDSTKNGPNVHKVELSERMVAEWATRSLNRRLFLLEDLTFAFGEIWMDKYKKYLLCNVSSQHLWITPQWFPVGESVTSSNQETQIYHGQLLSRPSVWESCPQPRKPKKGNKQILNQLKQPYGQIIGALALNHEGHKNLKTSRFKCSSSI